MPSLLDIAPPELAGKDIDVHGQKLSIRGLTADDFARLYSRFPELRQVVAGEDGADPDRMRSLQAECALVAAGTGHAGDPAHERLALAKLTRDERVYAMQEIIALSMPGAVFGPLLDAVQESGALATAA